MPVSYYSLMNNPGRQRCHFFLIVTDPVQVLNKYVLNEWRKRGFSLRKSRNCPVTRSAGVSPVYLPWLSTDAWKIAQGIEFVLENWVSLFAQDVLWKFFCDEVNKMLSRNTCEAKSSLGFHLPWTVCWATDFSLEYLGNGHFPSILTVVLALNFTVLNDAIQNLNA